MRWFTFFAVGAKQDGPDRQSWLNLQCQRKFFWTAARKDLISPESKSPAFFQKKGPTWKVCLPEEKLEISGCALLSGDKPPRPPASGCPQVHLRAKLQQIGRTVWDAGHLAAFTRRSIGRDSLTLSLTRALARSLGAYCKNNLHLIQSRIPPPTVCQSLTVAMDLQSVQTCDTVSYSVNTKDLKWVVLLFCLEWGSTVWGMPCQMPSRMKIS